MTKERNFTNAELLQKKVLNFNEVVQYTGFTPSYLYKITHKRLIPHSKPTGKMLFFEREKVENFLLGNPVATSDQLQKEAITYIVTNKKGGVL